MAGRFQFSLRNVFAATTWMAVWGAMFPFARFLASLGTRSEAFETLWPISVAFLVICLPCVAIGTLAGKAGSGWKVGGVLAVLVLTVALLFFLKVQ